ncbi:MAG: glycosyltransferase family 2 protein [Thermodesulfovibrionales bacterium]|nr:glycosyltransferase family 2 protein [Thermodesulfovibrionales bacterium]
MTLISVIIPIYNEEENLPILYQKLDEVAVQFAYDFEFIFIDDGSSDGSLRIIRELSTKDSRIKALSLSRNFGSHSACLAGLMYSNGDVCTFISADLQDPPELIHRLINEWRSGYEVVIGVREWKKDSGQFFQRLYYRLVRKFALKNMPESGTDVFLIDRKVVNAVISMGEKNTSIFGLILWSGFSQKVVYYKKEARYKGASKWTLGKKIKLFIDTFVSFSYYPLRVMSFLGITIAFTGFIYALIVIAARLFYSKTIEGWTSLMVVLLLVSGVQMILLGVLGEYLWRNFDESRRRPPFIVKDLIGIEEKKEK